MVEDEEELIVDGVAYRTRLPESYRRRRPYAAVDRSKVRANMPGRIVKILAEPGTRVYEDTPVLVLEAMKMENEVRAGRAGRLGPYLVAQGQVVEKGAALFSIDLD